MNDSTTGRSWAANLVAVGIGLAGAVLIWIVTSYNNFVLGGSNIADSFLPAIVLFLTLVLVMGVNPLLMRLRPGWTLGTAQLAIAVAIMLIACVLPCQGLLRSLPYTLANTARRVSENRALAEEYGRMDLPPGLFPDRLGAGQDTPAADGYLNELPPGQTIPWSAWAGPLLTWGMFLGCCWMMMVGLGMIVLPQWRHNERVAFPLLTVQQALIEPPGQGAALPGLLRKNSFRVAVVAVFVLHLLNGANIYWPESVPVIPLEWNLGSLFTSELWRGLHVSMYAGRVFFVFVGVAFFMPARISFSIWFFLVVYGVYRGLAPAYGIGQYCEKMDDQRFGAVILLTLAVLWIGRAHWRRVAASMVRRAKSRLDRSCRLAGWLFFAGLAGMFAWMVWLGVPAPWAAMLVAFSFMLALLVARIVAETGMPFVRLYERPLLMMNLAPVGWLTAPAVWLAAVVDMIFSVGGRVNATALATHGLGLDDRAGPSRRSRLGLVLLGTLAVGLVIAGAANLTTSYHHSTTLDGQPADRFKMSPLDDANKALMELSRGQLSRPPYNRYGHFAFGAALAGTLYYLCLTVPQWPVHPFGLMLIDSYFGHTAWPSIFFGWLLQTMVVRFGGSRVYRSARPFFLGLIVGEVAAAMFWAAVPAVMVAMDLPYKSVHILPG